MIQAATGPGLGRTPVAAGAARWAAIGYGLQSGRPAVERRRDPWAPFRVWVALTIGLFALRAVALGSPLPWLWWLGAIPGWVLLLMVLLALLLASAALLWPGRIVPWREGEPGLWAEISDDWRHWWRRHGPGGGAQRP